MGLAETPRPLGSAWYVIALLGPFVMSALTAIVAIAVGVPVRRTGAYTDWQAIGSFFLTTLIIVGLFEEVCWRGFACLGFSSGSMRSGRRWFWVFSGLCGIYLN